MSADRPVSPAPDTVTDDMVRVAAEAIEDVAIARIGRDLGTLHRDEIVRAGLEAVVPLIRAQVAAELAAPAPIDGLRPKVGEALGATAKLDIAWALPPLETSPDWGGIPRVITPAVPSTVAAPVTYTAAEGFYEDDEPVADVAAAFERAEKGVTVRPAITVDPADLRTVLEARHRHSHSRPGVWDPDNPPERANKPCVECAARERLRAVLEASSRGVTGSHRGGVA